MNVPANSTTDSIAEISFPDSLLNLAQWLDSQDQYIVDLAHKAGVQIQNNFLTHPLWKEHMGYSQGVSGRYYHPKTTNSERVLTVLMLREMILSGDI